MKEIFLRPHHSLCIQFFIGKGYSEEFVRGMNRIIILLKSRKADIILTDRCDDICRFCPNRTENECCSEKKVQLIDKACLYKYGLAPGDRLTWSELEGLAKEKIITCGKLKAVCRDCQWYDICSVLSSRKA